MALRTRNDHYAQGHAVKAERLVTTSGLVSELTGIPVQPNKPSLARTRSRRVGHPPGRRAQGTGTYEIMTPQSVGWEARRIVVSKLSGRRGLQGVSPTRASARRRGARRAYVLAMKRGDEVHELDERDLIAIAAEAGARRRSPSSRSSRRAHQPTRYVARRMAALRSKPCAGTISRRCSTSATGRRTACSSVRRSSPAPSSRLRQA